MIYEEISKRFECMQVNQVDANSMGLIASFIGEVDPHWSIIWDGKRVSANLACVYGNIAINGWILKPLAGEPGVGPGFKAYYVEDDYFKSKYRIVNG